MRTGQTRSPDLVEVLRAAVFQGLSDTHTAMPGRVEKYDSKKQKADVKPLLKRTVVNQDGSELSEELPVITDVPVVFPRGGGFFISFPLQKGDFVLLIFCERSIDNYMAGQGGDTDPVDLRMHDLSDAVAFPGFAPFSKAITDHNAEDLVMGKDEKGSQVAIKEGGVVAVTFDGGNTLKIEAKDGNAKMTVGDGAKHVAIFEHLQSWWDSQVKPKLDTSDSHVHANPSTYIAPLIPAPGPPVPVVPVTVPPAPPIVAPAMDTAVKSTKVTIPDG